MSADETFYLQQNELEQFERDGFLGPFPLLSEDECLAVRELLDTNIQPDNAIYLNEMRDTLERGDLWKLMYYGMYRHIDNPLLCSILRRTELTHRLAGMLGENLICWRSQFFEKQPGDSGTFWHQGHTFREGGQFEKLQPTVDRGPQLVQLTVWIALRDSTIENGCIRFLKGSHRTTVFADWEQRIHADNGRCLMPYIAKATPEKRAEFDSIIKASDQFAKAKWIFENVICADDPDYLENYPAIDVEMKAGEFIIFTSMLVHGSHPNTSVDDTRLSFVGRYTANDVKVFEGKTHDLPSRVLGVQIPCSLEKVGCIQVLGSDSNQFNKMIDV